MDLKPIINEATRFPWPPSSAVFPGGRQSFMDEKKIVAPTKGSQQWRSAIIQTTLRLYMYSWALFAWFSAAGICYRLFSQKFSAKFCSSELVINRLNPTTHAKKWWTTLRIYISSGPSAAGICCRLFSQEFSAEFYIFRTRQVKFYNTREQIMKINIH